MAELVDLAAQDGADACPGCGVPLLLGADNCQTCERDNVYARNMASLIDDNGAYVVRLASAGNPDFGQNPRTSLPGVPRCTVRVASLLAASQACRLYIAHFELGGGNWIGGDVKIGRKVVASVSYNGRVWNVESGRLRSEWTRAPEVPDHAMLPACYWSMGCQCAGHARGLPSAGRCDSNEVA